MGSRQPLPLQGCVDTHVHSSPDLLPRAQTDIELARSALAARMRALVLKNHHTPTVARAQIAAEAVPGIALVGGLVLNRSTCGGFNEQAVDVALRMGGRVIWMPTTSARNHLSFLRRGDVSQHIQDLSSLKEEEGLTPLTNNGRLLPEVAPILDLIAESQAILATGHLSSGETCILVEEARKRGVSRIIVTHPEAPQICMPLDIQRDLASLGIYFERCYYSLLTGLDPNRLLSDVRYVGISSTIAASDLGQAFNPPAVEGLAKYRTVLQDLGLTDNEWHTIASENAARLLELDSHDDDSHDYDA